MQASPPLPAVIFSPENIFPPHFQSIDQLITSRHHLAVRLSSNEQILVAHMLVALKKKITFNQWNEHRAKPAELKHTQGAQSSSKSRV